MYQPHFHNQFMLFLSTSLENQTEAIQEIISQFATYLFDAIKSTI